MKMIPFDLEIAKKIQSNDLEGGIVTSDGYTCNVVCWDVKNRADNRNLLVIVSKETGEEAYFYEQTGKTSFIDFELLLSVPEYTFFNEYDLIYDRDTNEVLMLHSLSADKKSAAILAKVDSNGVGHVYTKANNDTIDVTKHSLAILCERRNFYEKMAKQGYVFDTTSNEWLHKPVNFKPFDHVLVRTDNNCSWQCGIYSHKHGNQHVVNGELYPFCIPYEGNEHLVGTTKSPDYETV